MNLNNFLCCVILFLFTNLFSQTINNDTYMKKKLYWSNKKNNTLDPSCTIEIDKQNGNVRYECNNMCLSDLILLDENNFRIGYLSFYERECLRKIDIDKEFSFIGYGKITNNNKHFSSIHNMNATGKLHNYNFCINNYFKISNNCISKSELLELREREREYERKKQLELQYEKERKQQLLLLKQKEERKQKEDMKRFFSIKLNIGWFDVSNLDTRYLLEHENEKFMLKGITTEISFWTKGHLRFLFDYSVEDFSTTTSIDSYLPYEDEEFERSLIFKTTNFSVLISGRDRETSSNGIYLRYGIVFSSLNLNVESIHSRQTFSIKSNSKPSSNIALGWEIGGPYGAFGVEWDFRRIDFELDNSFIYDDITIINRKLFLDDCLRIFLQLYLF